MRALRKGRELTPVSLRVRSGSERRGAAVRDPAQRGPPGCRIFWRHYRRLGVGHFLVIDNDSDDGTGAILAAQPDVSVWRTPASYKGGHRGSGWDWINRLLLRHGAGHWCLTVECRRIAGLSRLRRARPLAELTAWLDRQGGGAGGIPALSATMLELYPKGPVGAAPWQGRGRSAGGDPVVRSLGLRLGVAWGGTTISRSGAVRGGGVFPFCRPALIWRRICTRRRWCAGGCPYVYLSSTHLALPRKLNRGFDARLNRPTGALLHTKFLPQVIDKSAEEKQRQEHFTHAERYGAYYDAVIADPDLWTPDSLRYDGPAQLEALGLISRGAWR